MPDLIARLLDGCTQDAYGCWITPRKPADTGYVKIGYRVDGRHHTALAHRLTYAHFRAEIPAGLVLDHLCRNRACINPWHLEPVSQRVNILRGTGASARNVYVERCPKGHPYDEANTHWRSRASRERPARECRACLREQRKRRPESTASAFLAAGLLAHLTQQASEDGTTALSVQQTADALGVAFSSVQRAIRRLAREGRIRKVAANRGPIPARYAITPPQPGPDGWVAAEPSDVQLGWRKDRRTA